MTAEMIKFECEDYQRWLQEPFTVFWRRCFGTLPIMPPKVFHATLKAESDWLWKEINERSELPPDLDTA